MSRGERPKVADRPHTVTIILSLLAAALTGIGVWVNYKKTISANEAVAKQNLRSKATDLQNSSTGLKISAVTVEKPHYQIEKATLHTRNDSPLVMRDVEVTELSSGLMENSTVEGVRAEKNTKKLLKPGDSATFVYLFSTDDNFYFSGVLQSIDSNNVVYTTRFCFLRQNGFEPCSTNPDGTTDGRRPFMRVEGIRPYKKGDRSLEDLVYLVIKNTGKTPAYKVEVNIASGATTSSLRTDRPASLSADAAQEVALFIKKKSLQRQIVGAIVYQDYRGNLYDEEFCLAEKENWFFRFCDKVKK